MIDPIVQKAIEMFDGFAMYRGRPLWNMDRPKIGPRRGSEMLLGSALKRLGVSPYDEHDWPREIVSLEERKRQQAASFEEYLRTHKRKRRG